MIYDIWNMKKIYDNMTFDIWEYEIWDLRILVMRYKI